MAYSIAEPNIATRKDVKAELRAWLDAFSTAVCNVDYDAGEALFATDVVGFGTVGVLLAGLETLIAAQWKRVWGVTSGFRFDIDNLNCRTLGDVAWLAVPWSSRTGRDEAGPHDRTGRATYVLERHAGKWLCVHCHHSLNPSGVTPGRTPRNAGSN